MQCSVCLSACSARHSEEHLVKLRSREAVPSAQDAVPHLNSGKPLRRLKADQMEAVFERKKRLLPRPTDLSFYNWDTQMSTSNATANFQVSIAASAWPE